MRSVDLSDLVERIPPIPYVAGGRDPNTGVDCLWVLLEVQRRLGFWVPPAADCDPHRRPEGCSLREWLEGAAQHWPEVPPGEPLRLGDALFESDDAAARVSAVVDPVDGLAATAIEGRGIALVRIGMIRGAQVRRFDPCPAPKPPSG